MTWTTRDQTVKPGCLVTFSLTSPVISGTFKIQNVTLTEIAVGGAGTTVFPLRRIEATSKLFTFDALLRRIQNTVKA